MEMCPEAVICQSEQLQETPKDTEQHCNSSAIENNSVNKKPKECNFAEDRIPVELAQKLYNIYQGQGHSESVYAENFNWIPRDRIEPRTPTSSSSSSPVPPPPVYRPSHVIRFPQEEQSRYSSYVPETVKRKLFQSGNTPVFAHSSPVTHRDEEEATKFQAPISYTRDPRMEPRSPHPYHIHFTERPESRQAFNASDYYESSDVQFYRPHKRRRSEETDNFSTSLKRRRIDLDREKSLRYLQELRSDVSILREKLRKPEPEMKRPLDCTCAVMEKQFLELAESAYRSIRRYDCTPRGFEQFRKELIQTNDVIKDSLDVLKHIKKFCEHNNT